MERRKAYFRKQKIAGGATLALGTAIPLLTGVGTLSVLLIPLGIYLLCTNRMVLMNDYFFEVKDEKEKRRQAYEAWKANKES